MNIITPSSHKRLVAEILQTGNYLVSEYLPNATATKSTYVERNSLVAVLADGTLVVECSAKSGTMHTVHSATSINKKLACDLKLMYTVSCMYFTSDDSPLSF